MSKLQPQRPQYDASAMQSATKNANATIVAKDERVSAHGGDQRVIAVSVGGQVHNYNLKSKTRILWSLNLTNFLKHNNVIHTEIDVQYSCCTNFRC